MPDKPRIEMEFAVEKMPTGAGGIRMREQGGDKVGNFYLPQDTAAGELGARTDAAGKVTADVRVKMTLELA